MLVADVRRIPLGTFTRPVEETGGAPRDDRISHADHDGVTWVTGRTRCAWRRTRPGRGRG